MAPTRTLKRLLNQYEERTHELLAEICAREGTSIFAKARLADVLSIEGSGIHGDDFRFALQSHLDFIVADKEHMPLFAVEYDGKMHQTASQQQRDARKNRLCEQFGLPLLRINSRYILKEYRGLDLLSWFVEAWFAAQAFEKAQEEGYVPADEPFSGWSFIGIPGRKKRFPLWLSADVQLKIRRLAEAGKCADPIPSQIIGADSDDNRYALSWLRLTPETVVWARTAMRSQLFPVSTTEVVSEIVVHDLYRQLIAVLDGRQRAVPVATFEQLLARFSVKYKLRQALSYGAR